MIKHIVWSTALAIAAIAFASSHYYVEEERQAATMMKLCLESGREWVPNWANRNHCEGKK